GSSLLPGSVRRRRSSPTSRSTYRRPQTGTTYTFRLRRVPYSNGRLVQPEDFRRAIERLFRVGAGWSPLFTSIVGATACTKLRCDLSRGIVVDHAHRTITFRLTRPACARRSTSRSTVPRSCGCTGGAPDGDPTCRLCPRVFPASGGTARTRAGRATAAGTPPTSPARALVGSSDTRGEQVTAYSWIGNGTVCTA